jgi:hypothetical protein
MPVQCSTSIDTAAGYMPYCRQLSPFHEGAHTAPATASPGLTRQPSRTRLALARMVVAYEDFSIENGASPTRESCFHSHHP